MVDELDKQGIASDFIDDESFHVARPCTECELCRDHRMTKSCRSCPASPETRSFFQSIREMHEEVRGSARYHRDREPNVPAGRGVVIIAGRSVLSEEALHRVASVRLWLDEDQDNCIKQIVVDSGNWTLSPIRLPRGRDRRDLQARSPQRGQSLVGRRTRSALGDTSGARCDHDDQMHE